MYRVIKEFFDLQDGNHVYKVGDTFPHNNKTVSAKRIDELATNKNKQGIPLIEEIPEEPIAELKKKRSKKVEE